MRLAQCLVLVAVVAAPAYAAQECSLIAAQLVEGQLVLAVENRKPKYVQVLVIPKDRVSLEYSNDTGDCVVSWGDGNNFRVFEKDDSQKLMALVIAKTDALKPEIKKALGLP